MSKRKRIDLVRLPDSWLSEPVAIRAIYETFVDSSPVVGTVQMLCELQRLVSGGRACGGLHGRAVMVSDIVKYTAKQDKRGWS